MFSIQIVLSGSSWTRLHIGLMGQIFMEAPMKTPSTWGHLVENSRWFETHPKSKCYLYQTLLYPQETSQRGRQGSLPSCAREPSGKVTGCDVCGSGKKVKDGASYYVQEGWVHPNMCYCIFVYLYLRFVVQCQLHCAVRLMHCGYCIQDAPKLQHYM